MWIIFRWKRWKISKSKGNGITIDQWLNYASPESLSLYMYQNPKELKAYKEIVPKTVDEYLDLIEKAKNQNELQLLMNPLWHIHDSDIPKENSIMSFQCYSTLLKQVMQIIKNFYGNSWKNIKIFWERLPYFDKLVDYAIKFFDEVIKPQKKYKIPNKDEKGVEALVKTLDKCNDEMSPEDIQTLIYSTGKDNGYSENLREWFKLIYQVVFGDENGPRLGFL